MSRSLANTLDDTNVVSTHVKRHWNDLFVQFHADFFLGLGNAGNTSFLAFERTHDDFDDAADFDSRGHSLWLKVREDVLQGCFTRKDGLGVLEWALIQSTTS